MSSVQVRMPSLKWTSSNVKHQRFRDDDPIRMNETEDFVCHLMSFIIYCCLSPHVFCIGAVIPDTHKTQVPSSLSTSAHCCALLHSSYCQCSCISFCSRRVKSNTCFLGGFFWLTLVQFANMTTGRSSGSFD